MYVDPLVLVILSAALIGAVCAAAGLLSGFLRRAGGAAWPDVVRAGCHSALTVAMVLLTTAGVVAAWLALA